MCYKDLWVSKISVLLFIMLYTILYTDDKPLSIFIYLQNKYLSQRIYSCLQNVLIIWDERCRGSSNKHFYNHY